MINIGTVILAAGNSSRLGRAKQTLPFLGSTLLEIAIKQVKKADLGPVVVVVGAYAPELTPLLSGEEVVYNAEWERGMGTSIAAGLRALETKGIDAVMLCVSDQPFVHAAHFRRLAAALSRHTKVGSAYGGSVGVPCIFGKSHLEKLRHLEPQHGAKTVLLEGDVRKIPFPAGNRDIDTPREFELLEQEMLSADEALAVIYQQIPNLGSELVPLQEAFGRVLAEDIYAALDLPPFSQSSMDGYALRFEDRGKNLQVIGELRAGAAQQLVLGAGQAVRVFTGAPLPEGADTVIMQEKVQRNGTCILCLEPEMHEGMHVRQIGAEVKRGSLAVSSGTVLHSAALGYLGSLGQAQVRVKGRPRVTLVLNGDELVPAGKALEFGQVYESNSLALMSAFKAAGIEDVCVKFVRDDKQEIYTTLRDALAISDLVVSVGGVSVGEYDLVVPVAEEVGVKRLFHKVKQKPGKPLYFGTKEQVLFLGLPGNPSSALVCFYVYLMPLLREWQGKGALPRCTARAKASYSKKAGLTHFLKAWYDEGEVWPLGAQESYRMHSFKEANALMVVPENGDGVKEGDVVEIIRLS